MDKSTNTETRQAELFPNITQVERRYFNAPVEKRADSSDGFDFRGLASSTGIEYTMYEDENEVWVEEIDVNAFDGVLENDVRVLVDHINHMILGRTSSNTAEIWKDAVGLRYKWKNPATTAGNDIAISIKRGDVTQSSFGFRTGWENNKWEDYPMEDGRRKYKRTILKIDELFDVSPVTFPANPETDVQKNSFEAGLKKYREAKRAAEERNEPETKPTENQEFKGKNLIEIDLAIKEKMCRL